MGDIFPSSSKFPLCKISDSGDAKALGTLRRHLI